MRILAIDPSGNFNEGKGTTGWSLFTDNKELLNFGQIKASDYDNVYEYTQEHINLITKYTPDIVVIEDFKLYADKAKNQINSRFETPKLIGTLQFYCYKNNIPTFLQSANEVKTRWNDDILLYYNIIQKHGNKYYINEILVSDHIRDSIRHGIHFTTFKLGKVANND